MDYILPEFEYYWETPFGETDASFPNCDMDRPQDGDADELMYIVNHFLNIEIPFVGIKIPDRGRASETNSLESIGDQVELCRGMWGETANVILVSCRAEQKKQKCSLQRCSAASAMSLTNNFAA